MRSIKEPNYSALREVLTQNCGGVILNWMRDHQQQIGLDVNIFELAYDSFWEIYTFKA